MLGSNNQLETLPGTIRGDFCTNNNLIDCSDSFESAEKDIQLWFKSEELIDYKKC